MQKNGFTLMEILAVVLIVALVASMAIPVYHTVRNEMRYNQARAAAAKMADALRSFYVRSRGASITANSCFTPTTSAGANVIFEKTCSDITASGIPGNKSCSSPYCHVKQLFACGYLSYRDFASLPYEFCVCDPNGSATSCASKSGLLVRVTGTSDAGKYDGKSFSFDKNMTFTEE